MYFKLSIRNARRQAKDYLVYFVTVVMAVALVYAFNGLVFSQEIKALSKLLVNLPVLIVSASIVVVFIVSWLVSYTVNFMLARRSREFGIYILTGLENRQVARLFFAENMLVGGCALVLGLVIGNLLYQILRAVVLALFGVVYTFSFSFSMRSVALTLFYFLVIYLFAQFRSRKRIRSMKIHDLIYFDRVNEGVVIQTGKKRRRVFSVSIVLGITGTVLLMTNDFMVGMVGSGCIILFLYGFFLSFASGVPAYFDKRPERKYQGQNLLVFRTLTAKLATMGVTMANIALLFTATLVSEGTGQIFNAIFQGRLEAMSCFDLMVSHENSESERYRRCLDYVRENIPVEASWQYDIYLSGEEKVADEIEANTEYYRSYPSDTVMRASDYYALRKMLGYPSVTLGKGQYLIHCQPYVKKALKDWVHSVTVGGYALAMGGIYTENFAQYLWDVNGNGFILVAPDEAVEGCQIHHNIYAALTKEPVSEKQYRDLDRIAYGEAEDYALYGAEGDDAGENGGYDVAEDDQWSFVCARSADEEEAASMTAMLVFPLYYLALILTMTAATILTIQQLSETGRYKQQFGLLRKLGMEPREMERALGKQFAIYYAMPALPSVLIGSVFVANLGRGVEPGIMVGSRHPLVVVGIMLMLFSLIYAVYIVLAYTGLRRNVLEK